MSQFIMFNLSKSLKLCEKCSVKFLAITRTFGSSTRNHKTFMLVCNRSLVKDMISLHKRSKLQPMFSISFLRQYTSRPVFESTMDEDELENFKALAESWWDETGNFEALHAMNKLRVPFIRNGLLNERDDVPSDPSQPLQGLNIVDAGSGGGLLTEPLARLGASVIGVDPVEVSTKIAQLHLSEDTTLLPRVKYITGTTEDLVVTEAETFDAVVASEVVEHVADLVTFVNTCCKLVKPGGSVFITTMNKTQLSKGLAVFAAEKVFQVVPDGTHDWEKFVPPKDLQSIMEKNGVYTRVLHGMLYNPVTREWSWVDGTSINYAIHAVKSYNHENEETP